MALSARAFPFQNYRLESRRKTKPKARPQALSLTQKSQAHHAPCKYLQNADKPDFYAPSD